MKIAIIGSHGYPFIYGGFETFVQELSERIINYSDIEITVYCRKNYFSTFPENINGIKLVYINTIKRKSLAQLIHSFRSIIHATFNNFDILYILNSGNGIFGIIPKIFKVKTIINVDGIEWKRPKWKGLGAKYFLLSSFIATKIFDIIITDSMEMQKIYKNKFNCDSMYIAYGEERRVSTHKEILLKWNIEPYNYYLVVGRLVPDNNIELIIDEFINSNSRLELVIVGDDILKDSFSKRIIANKNKKLKFLGYVFDHDELNELFCNCFAYIHGHEFGGTNPTLLQALASNIPIFALDTVFSREVLDNDKYGFLFVKEKNFLANLIKSKEKNSKEIEHYRDKTFERINDFYKWDEIVSKYYNIFIQLNNGN